MNVGPNVRPSDTLLASNMQARGVASHRLYTGDLVLDQYQQVKLVLHVGSGLGITRLGMDQVGDVMRMTANPKAQAPVSTVETAPSQEQLLDAFKEKVVHALDMEFAGTGAGAKGRILHDLGLLNKYEVTLHEVREIEATSPDEAKRKAFANRGVRVAVTHVIEMPKQVEG